MAQGAGNTANGNLVKGMGSGARQWTDTFTLTDTDGSTALFSVDQTGAVYAAGAFTTAGVVDGGGNASISGTLSVTGATTLTGALSGSTASLSGLLTSTVAAGSDVFKFTATNATPTVAWTDSGAANHAPTTAPAGYLQVKNGSTVHYIPFWS